MPRERTNAGSMTASASQDAEIENLNEVLREMADRGQFLSAVLASAEGLPIAAASSHEDAEATSAMIAMLRRVSGEAKEQLALAEVDEVSIRDSERSRLVCRCLTVSGEHLLLAVRVRPRGCYRRETNWAIRQIERLWADWQE